MKHHGDYVGIFLLRDPVLLVTSPEFARKVLLSDFNYFTDHGIYSNEEVDPLAANVFFMRGDRWRKLRMKLTPSFTSGKLRAMFHTIVDVGKKLDQYLEARCAKVQLIDVKELLARFLTDVIASWAFGIESNSLNDPQSHFRQMGKQMVNLPKYKALKMLGVRFNSKHVSDYFISVVQDTMRHRKETNSRRDDFMQLLIDMMKKTGSNQEDGLTFEEIASQAYIFFFAGFETSTTTMTCALHLMAKHPKVQHKARQCVKDVLEKYNNELSYDAVNEMEYLGCIISETLRMYPPVASIHRETTQPYQLANGAIIPKGIGVIISNLAFHYDPEHFPNPYAFKPDRFAGTTDWKNNFSYLPFGEGPRMCIGMRFALLQTRLGLAMLLRNYNFTMDSCEAQRPLRIHPINLMHGPADEVWLEVKSIKKSRNKQIK
ncbi:probable cytochrome P450 6a17 [Anopheles nili]|uniref:probable cytochrome P450 6a17 n=1 Tax=Anopheles nili TaxID=185578 RepID=UPI00237A2EDA|nr:probable cytochrome P450 6a17 [Anopheles nili]